MEMKLNLNLDVESLPPLKKNLLMAGPSVVIIAVFVMLWILPAFQEKEKLDEEVAKQKSEIATLQKNSALLATLKNENIELKNRLVELQKQLPEEREVSGLLKEVSNLGIKTGLQIVSWKPRDKTVHSSKEVYEIPVDVEVRGSYHMFGLFLSNISKLSRIVNFSNISMKSIPQKGLKEAGPNLYVNFTALTYSMIPEKERKALIEKEKKELEAKKEAQKKK